MSATRRYTTSLGHTVVPTITATPIERNVAGSYVSGAAATGQHPAVVDLFDGVAGVDGYFSVEVITQNGKGSTPTAPGGSSTITVHFATVATPLDSVSDAPTVLEAIKTSLECTLPNSSSGSAAGARRYANPSSKASGRYLYAWYDHTEFATNAEVSLVVNIVAN